MIRVSLRISKAVKAARLLLCLAAAGACLAQDTGPAALVITYRCAPGQRVALRQYMLGSGLRQFRRWKEAGIVADYRVLFSRYVDTDGWDIMSLLTFSTYSGLEKWRAVESATPAGLSTDALALTFAVNSFPALLMRRNASDAAPVQPVYLVIPYTISVPTAECSQYVDEYVRPQLDALLETGGLANYGLYLQRYGGARPWDSLLVLEYTDEEALGDREKMMAKVRERLSGNPVWQARSDREPSIHVEKQAAVADELVIGR